MMLKRTNRHRMIIMSLFLFTILVVDVLALISTIYVNVQLDDFAMPDYVLNGKIIIEVILLGTMFFWIKNDRFKLTKDFVKYSLVFIIFLLSTFVVTMYLYKYTQLLESLDIVKNKILLGNPSLIFEYTRINYTLVQYLVNVYQGLTSEVVLFFQLMILMFIFSGCKDLEVENGPIVEYDPFMYKKNKPLYYVLLAAAIFASLSLFDITFEKNYQGYGIMIGLFVFYLAILSAVISFKINRMQFGTATKSLFVAYNKQLIIFGIAMIVMLLIMLVFVIIDIRLGVANYRLYSIIISIAGASYLVFDTFNTLSYENK